MQETSEKVAGLEVVSETQGIAAAEEQGLRMDFSLETPEERCALVQKIVDNTSPEKLTPKYLEKLADYLVFPIEKEERKQKHILTDNHMVTVNKREMSFEGLVSKFENGEDGIYGMIANDKNIIFMPKVEITPQDIAAIPGMAQLRAEIDKVAEQEKKAKGIKRKKLHQQLIEMRKDQYVLKNAYKKPIYFMNVTRSLNKISLDDNITIKEDGELDIKGTFSFLNPDHISAMLCNYSRLKEDSYGVFYGDTWYVLMDLEDLIERTLPEEFPLYYKLMIYKIDGKTNEEIQSLLYEEFDIKHSVVYISSLWRNKIPKLLAAQAQKEYLEWYYTTQERGKWKRCTKCGQIKLAHNTFFSKNKSSKDGFYSICKDCKNGHTNPEIISKYQAEKLGK